MHKSFSPIKDLKVDIIFLQEKHLYDSDQRRLSRPWIGQIFHSKFSLKTRGAAKLIRKNVHFTHSDVLADINSRYVSGTLVQKPRYVITQALLLLTPMRSIMLLSLSMHIFKHQSSPTMKPKCQNFSLDWTCRQITDASLWLSEIIDEIKSVHNGKSPGPIAFPVEFYEKFSAKLFPLHLRDV